MNYKKLLQDLELHADPERAQWMSQYMRDQFEFLGVYAPERKQVTKIHFQSARDAESPDWTFIDECWKSPYRELQYVAGDYLKMLNHTLTPKDIPQLKKLVQAKSWWDTIDFLDQIIGNVAERYPEVNKTLVTWSTHDDFWLRRIAIDHQRGRKELTNTELLAQIIKNNFGDTEFFINKAIGWSLREYSKTDPEWVQDFIAAYKDEMSPLSVREASKYL